jgi:hypothetical protein
MVVRGNVLEDPSDGFVAPIPQESMCDVLDVLGEAELVRVVCPEQVPELAWDLSDGERRAGAGRVTWFTEVSRSLGQCFGIAGCHLVTGTAVPRASILVSR